MQIYRDAERNKLVGNISTLFKVKNPKDKQIFDQPNRVFTYTHDFICFLASMSDELHGDIRMMNTMENQPCTGSSMKLLSQISNAPKDMLESVKKNFVPSEEFVSKLKNIVNHAIHMQAAQETQHNQTTHIINAPNGGGDDDNGSKSGATMQTTRASLSQDEKDRHLYLVNFCRNNKVPVDVTPRTTTINLKNCKKILAHFKIPVPKPLIRKEVVLILYNHIQAQQDSNRNNINSADVTHDSTTDSADEFEPFSDTNQLENDIKDVSTCIPTIGELKERYKTKEELILAFKEFAPFVRVDGKMDAMYAKLRKVLAKLMTNNQFAQKNLSHHRKKGKSEPFQYHGKTFNAVD